MATSLVLQPTATDANGEVPAVPGSVAPGIPDVAKSVTATNQIPQALAQPMSENGPLAAVFPDGTTTTIPPNSLITG